LSTNNIDNGGTGDGDPGSFNDGGDGGGGGGGVSRLQKAVISVLTATVPWIFAFRSIEDFEAFLQSFVLRVINFWVVDRIIRPVVQAVLGIGAAIVDGVLVIAFGTDKVIGGRPGLADVPLWVADTVIPAAASVGGSLLGVIDGFNESLAAIAADAGLAAPPIVAGLWIAEGAVVGYLVWTVISVIDLPVIDLDDLIVQLTFPARWLARRLT